MTYRFIWYSSLETNDFPAPAYDDLLSRMPHATPFNRLVWLRSCAEHLGSRQLAVLTAWQGEQLLLCLPLTVGRERRLGTSWRVVRHLGDPLADRIVLALVSGDKLLLEEALTQIRRKLPHALLQLSEVLATNESEQLLACWRQHSFVSDDRVSCQVPEHQVSAASVEKPPKDVRYELRRSTRRCTEAGASIRRWVPGSDNIAELLGSVADVEQGSWKGDQGLGLFSGPHRALMKSAITALAAEGRVRVVSLEKAGRCISYRLGLLESGRLYDYNVAFLPEYGRLGSGRLLLNEWLLWGLDEGWDWVDASRVGLRNSSHQLHERMDGLVENRRWSFYSFRPGGIVLGSAYRIWSWLKPLIKRGNGP